MTSAPSIREFVATVKDLDYGEIEDRTQAAIAAAEKRHTHAHYATQLKGLAYWLSTGRKPGGLLDLEFLEFRPICESLVSRRLFRPEAMAIFLERI